MASDNFKIYWYSLDCKEYKCDKQKPVSKKKPRDRMRHEAKKGWQTQPKETFKRLLVACDRLRLPTTTQRFVNRYDAAIRIDLSQGLGVFCY